MLFLRKYGRALFRKSPAPEARLAALDQDCRAAAEPYPPIGRKPGASAIFNASPPWPCCTYRCRRHAGRYVLEPSAGTGLLAVLAEIAGARLILNEFAQTRADLLSALFPAAPVNRFDAAQIDDHLDASYAPTVVLINPPFSAMAHVEGRTADAALRHIASALNRLVPGGRLVTITGANFSPEAPTWREAFVGLQQRATMVFTAAIDGAVYARHGTNFATRLTVFDKRAVDDPNLFPASSWGWRRTSPPCFNGSKERVPRAVAALPASAFGGDTPAPARRCAARSSQAGTNRPALPV